jgi:hypothetical protein
LQNVEWGEFRIEDVLQWQSQKEIDPLKLEELKDETETIYPFYGQATVNNGIISYHQLARNVLNNESGKPTILIHSNNQNIVYLETPFYLKDGHGATSVLQSDKLNKVNQMFIVASIDKVIKSKYSYNNKATKIELKNTVINLPTKNSMVDFEFMESFIAELEAERIAKLEAYLLATGLRDYTLTAEEKQVLDDFEQDKIEWGEFKVGDLLDKLELKTLKKPFDKLSDTSNIQTDEFNLPLVNAKFGNNGIMFYGREKDFDTAEMTIDVISNGAIATGTVYSQPYKIGILWDAYLLKPKVVDISKHKLLFFTTSLEKSIKMKFGWDNKAVWSKVQHELISLPRQDKQPNYAVMETLISAIQKLVIKEVVLYADRKIAATKTVVNK